MIGIIYIKMIAKKRTAPNKYQAFCAKSLTLTKDRFKFIVCLIKQKVYFLVKITEVLLTRVTTLRSNSLFDNSNNALCGWPI